MHIILISVSHLPRLITYIHITNSYLIMNFLWWNKVTSSNISTVLLPMVNKLVPFLNILAIITLAVLN